MKFTLAATAKGVVLMDYSSGKTLAVLTPALAERVAAEMPRFAEISRRMASSDDGTLIVPDDDDAVHHLVRVPIAGTIIH